MFDKHIDDLKTFVKEREWETFHNPKNLATVLSIEASELLEHFLWTNDGYDDLSEQKQEAVREEVGDVLNALLLFCDKCGIDPLECAVEKLKKTSEKYPVHLARGNAKKYHELHE